MSEPLSDPIQDLFDQAVTLPPAQRAAFLEAACAGTPALRAELESLLACDAEFREGAGESLLQSPLVRSPGCTSGLLPLPRQVGEYEVLAEVARGGMGVVYKARHRLLQRLVALKMVLAGDFASPSQLLRIRLEAELAARVQHPNIVQVYEIGNYAGRPFLALEWVDGGSLADRLDGSPWTPGQAARLIEILARAIHVAHEQGVVHRDLKPANVLLAGPVCRTGPAGTDVPLGRQELSAGEVRPDSPTYKITDFGLAQPRESGRALTQSGLLVGTPGYMAPEQAGGKRALVGPATDIYALGVMLYQLSTGQLPFQGDSTLEVLQAVMQDEAVRPRRLQPHIPRDLEAITLRCLEKEPARRYPSALALAEDLSCFQQGKPIRARPVGRLERFRKWARRRPAVAALTLAVLALVLFVMVAGPFAAWREVRLRGEAEARERDARAAQASEAKLRREAEQQSLRLTLEKAWSLPEQGQVAEGMLWLVRCLEVAPADDANLQQAIRANLAAWYGQLHPLRAQLPHGAQITSLAFSPDGTRIATGGLDKTVRLWDTRTGQPIGPPLLHDEAVQAVAFRGDGKRLVVATVTPRVYTWESWVGRRSGDRATPPRPGQETRPQHGPMLWPGLLTRPQHEGNTTTWKLVGEPLKNAAWPAGERRVILSPNGSHVLVVGTDGTGRLWEAESGKAVGAPLPLQDATNTATAFSPDGCTVISSSSPTNSRVQVQEALTGRTVGKVLLHPASVSAAALSPDARLVLVGGYDGTARIWDLLRGEPMSLPLRHHEAVLAVAFSPDGRSVATSGTDNMVRLWEAPTGRPLGPLLRCGAPGNPVVFSPDGSCLAAAGTDGTARLWQVGRRQPEGEPLRHPHALLAVAFAPDGRRAATACWDGTFLEWDLATRRPVGKAIHRQRSLGMAVAYSPDGARILTAGWDQPSAQQWDAITRQPVGKAFTNQHLILDAAYSPDGSKIITGSWGDNTARLWDARTGEPLGPPLRHNDQVHAVAFHPEGTRILTGSYDKTARVWDARTLQPLGPPLLHADQVSEAAFSPDGSLILTTTDDGLAQLWDAATGQPLGEPMRHQATIRRAAFSPDGRRIVTASHDGTARIWDVATRRSLGPPLEHPGAVKAVAFSPDGRRILTGDATGRAWLWDAVQPVVQGEPERFQLWVVVSTGQELDADTGRIRVLDFPTWDGRRLRLAERGGPILPWDR